MCEVKGMHALVTFIIPVFNAENTIAQAIQSVINQTYTLWELILVDDGSKDNSLNICREYADKDNRIKYVSIPNSGVSIARNKGLEFAKGEWICFIDSDDYIENNTIELCQEYFSDFDVIAYGIETFPEKTKMVASKKEIYCSFFDTKKSFYDLYNIGFYNSPCNKIYKRSIIKKGFNPNYSLGEDLLFNLDVLRECNSICVLPFCLYNYRQSNNSSLTRQINSGSLKLQMELKNAIIETFEKDESVTFTLNSIFEQVFIGLIWSIIYAGNYSKKDKVEILRQWCEIDGLSKELSQNKSQKFDSKVVIFLINKKAYSAIYWIGLVRKYSAFMIRKVKGLL